MDSLNKAKKGRVGEEQKLYLVEFLEQNPELRSGKFTSTFTYKTSQKCWNEIASQPNAVGPVQKEWKQWRKTWQVMISNTKAKSSEIRKHRQGTGGGEPLKDLSASEERVLNVIGEVAVSGHPNTLSSSVLFNDMEVVVDDHDYNYDTLDSDNTTKLDIAETSLLVEVDSSPLQNKKNRRINFLLTKPVAAKKIDMNEPGTEVTGTKVKRHIKSRRLDNSIQASERLAEQVATKLDMKQHYYNAKLKLLQESIAVQSRIATALEKIAEAMN